MADLATASDEHSGDDATESRPRGRVFSGLRQNQSLRVLGFVVVFASVLMSSASFLILSGITTIEPSPAVWTVIWIVTGLLVLLVIALVVTEAVLLFQSRLRGVPGADAGSGGGIHL